MSAAAGPVRAGRTAVITGAASGIGAALARHAARQGMAVAACDRDAAGLKRLRGDLVAASVPHALHLLDVTDPSAMAGFADAAQRLAPVTLLFANAGMLRMGSVLRTPLDQWRGLFDVNLIGTVIALQAFVPTMIEHGEPACAVVTGSTASMTTAPDLAAYCATKYALWPIVEALASELAGTRVGASLLMPGAVATGIFAHDNPNRTAPADSISPERVAEIAFAGATAGLAKILTHPAFTKAAEARFTRVLDELAGK
ncbi:SDR family NAD(P)-dependent oxidoreductase [Sphingomonas populi]|uniref:SDR family NAD(P)-dependent oxidoreductase n=1 Tax=Sphingomonas populi TaxID=2484750 RepID=A0A4Q6Y5P1_9SPHN|nr:SDR family NAD(P)-dependent oxidoreductase [Sphingomonas populi]RZF64747.1 SDR family NAD(P)-dependent oxidoreductase [Sphingomonas populi]